MQPDFSKLKPVATPGAGPDMSALKPVGVTPPPAAANNPGTGLAYGLFNGVTALAGGITRAVDKPFLSLLGVPKEVYDSVTGNLPSLQAGQSTGYDFGSFFGNAKPLGAGIPNPQGFTAPPQTIQARAALNTIADTAGLALEAGTDLINPIKEPVVDAAKAVAPAVEKGIGPAVKGAAKAIGKFTFGSGRAQFATAQGVSAGLEDLGSGDSPTGAAVTGIGTGLASGAAMKVLDVTGNAFKDKLGFMPSVIKTKAGQVFSKTLDSIGNMVNDIVNNDAIKGVADRFQSSYNDVQSQVNNATLNVLGGIRKYIKLPDQETWVKGMVKQIGGKLNSTRNDIQEGFDKVFGSGTIIKDASKTKAAYEEALSQIHALGGDTFKNVKDPEARAGLSSNLAPNLYQYMNRIKSDILDPVAKGKGFNMNAINHYSNFVDAKGTGGEEALMGKLRTSLHQDVEAGLGAMGKKGTDLLTAWDSAKGAYKDYANTKNSAMVNVWNDIKNPLTIANKFLDGSVLSDKSQVKDLEGLIGPEGIGAIRSTIMHTALSNAIDHFSSITSTSLPEDFDAARKAASDEIQKFIDVAGSKTQLKPTGSGFQAFSGQQMKWMQDAQQFIKGFNMENIAKGFGLPSAEETAAKSEALDRGRSIYEAAKTPSALATSISKLTNIEDIKSAMSFVKTPKDKAVVAANFLKNAFGSLTTAFKPSLEPEGFSKAVDSVLNFGGTDKKAAYDEVFGKSPATDQMVKDLDNAANATKAFAEEKTPSALKAVANAGIAAFFSSMGHPIIAVGAAKRAVDEGLAGRGEDLFTEYTGKSKAEILKTLETNGEIDATKTAKFFRKVGTVIKSRIAQGLTGITAAKGTEDILGTDTSNQ